MQIPALPKFNDVTLPNEQDAELAKCSHQILTQYFNANETPNIKLEKPSGAMENLVLPAPALKLLYDILEQMAKGSIVTVFPLQVELTTREAAHLLNVSRPYLVSLLEKGEIPYRKVGSKRRILAQDIIRFKADIDRHRLETLEKLSAQAQQLNMGY